MKLIFFFILRRFFVKLRVENEFIVLEKKLFVTVKTVLYRDKIVRVQTRRTPIMRVLGAKEVTLFTQGGKTRFYLRGNEKCELLPKRGKSVKLNLIIVLLMTTVIPVFADSKERVKDIAVLQFLYLRSIVS